MNSTLNTRINGNAAKYWVLLIITCMHPKIYSQDWSNLSNDPKGHDPHKCMRCIVSFNKFGIKKQDTGEFKIDNYRVQSFGNFTDDMVHVQDGKRKLVDVSDISTLNLPNKIQLVSGAEIDLVNIGIRDSDTIQVEVKHDATSIQSFSQRAPLKLNSICEETQRIIRERMSEFLLPDGTAFLAFIQEIDQGKLNVALKGGTGGIVKHFKVDSLTDKKNKISKLHKQRYKGIREAGYRILVDKENVYRKMHLINPIDVEDEARKEEESRRQGEIIDLLNASLEKLHYTFWQKYNADYDHSIPPFEPIFHEQYYAHPTWEEIADVFKQTSTELRKKLDSWEDFVKELRPKPLKIGQTNVDEARKITALGKEPIEGFYKFKTTGGEGRIYLYPKGKGKSIITTAMAVGVGSLKSADKHVYRNYHECDFSWNTEATPDQSFTNLILSDFNVNNRSKIERSINGSTIDSYEFTIKQGALQCKDVEMKRIRSWARIIKQLD